MATSATPAASASISVWPGQGWPAARSDSLWSGAVTTPSTRPASASRAAASTARAAARPAGGGNRADRDRPAAHVDDLDAQGRGRRQPEAADPILEGGERSVHDPVRPRPAPDESALRTISGPIPAGSPAVRASRGRRLTFP